MNLKLTILLFLCAGTFSVLADNWQQRMDYPSLGRHRGTAISIGTKGYMGLGHYNGAGPNIILSDWWEYDPATNAWTQKVNHPNGNYGVISFGIGNVGFVGSGQVNSSFYKYDPAMNEWILMNSTPAGFSNSDAFVVGEKAYCIPVNSNNLFEYNYLNDTWIQKNNAPFSIGSWSSTFTISEKGYVKVGSSLWEYKPSIDQWIARAQFPGIATSGSVALTQYGKGIIITGYGGSLGNVTSEVWGFDPYLNAWDSLQEFAGTSRRFAAGFSIGNKCFLGLGTNGTNFGDFWELDATANFDELFNVEQFVAYPNPAVETIRFKSENLSSFEITIFDIQGKKINSLKTDSGSINFLRNSLTGGTYFYTVEVNGSIVHNNTFIFK